MLMQAHHISRDYGTGNEDILVIDQKGILRLRTNALGTGSYAAVNRQVDALINQSPVISLSRRQRSVQKLFFSRTTKTETITINNSGTGPLTVTDIRSDIAGIAFSETQFTVPADQSHDITVTFTPQAEGTFAGTIDILSDDPQNATISLTVEGRVTAIPVPSISLVQESLGLGEIEVGDRITETITIDNSGTGPLAVTDIQSDIAGITFSETQFTVPADQSHDITVTFNPQAEGAITGTIDIQSNDPENATISLTLTGSVTAIPVPSIALVQESLRLGEIEVGNRITETITIDNSGTGPLTVTDIRSDIAGITFSETQFTVPADQSHDITVTFNPQAEGAITGTIDIQSDDPENATISLTLTGLVTAIPVPSIALIQESLGLGEIEVGNRITETITIDNSGTGPLAVTDIQSDIAGITFSETQFTVPADQSHDITVTFNPQAEGAITGTIDILSDDPENATISLTLTGSVTGPRTRSDFDGSGEIDFSDFLLFAEAFGTANEKFDLNNSGSVDFPDFLIFVANFGKTVN